MMENIENLLVLMVLDNSSDKTHLHVGKARANLYEIEQKLGFNLKQFCTEYVYNL